MLSLLSLGSVIAERRKERHLRQIDLAQKAHVSRATIDALENGRLGELGVGKITRILSALDLDLTVGDARKRRPTLDELMQEDQRDQSLGGRR